MVAGIVTLAFQLTCSVWEVILCRLWFLLKLYSTSAANNVLVA
jgi:hypothetical protein